MSEVAKKKPEPSPEPSPEERAAACIEEVNAVLKKHGCHIRTYMSHEAVGNDGARVLTTVSYTVVPE